MNARLSPNGVYFNGKLITICGLRLNAGDWFNHGMDIKSVRIKNLGSLIKERAHGNATAFSALVGRSQSMISDLMSGRKSFGEKLARSLEERLGIDSGSLDRDQTTLSPPSPPPVPEPSNVREGPALVGRVPLISWVRAGDMCEAEDPLEPGDAIEWVSTSIKVRRHTYALLVDGDSMEPEFQHGMIIIVEPDMQAEPGDP